MVSDVFIRSFLSLYLPSIYALLCVSVTLWQVLLGTLNLPPSADAAVRLCARLVRRNARDNRVGCE